MPSAVPTVMVAGKSTLYASDAVEFLRAYTGRPFDVTVTSPPYGLDKRYDGTTDAWEWADYLDWTEQWGKWLLERTSERGRLILNIPLDSFFGGRRIPFDAEVTMSMIAAGWTYQTKIIWDKIVTTSKTAYGSWMSPSAPTVFMPAEAIIVFSKGDWVRGKHGRTSDIARDEFMEYRSSIWRRRGESAKTRGHPAPYPEEIVRRALLLFAFKEDLIFDPFVGSGTTCAVAERLGMESVGVDVSAEYLGTLATPRILAAADEREGALVDSAGVRYINSSLLDALA